MWRSLQAAYFGLVVICLLMAASASGHPASGIVVDANGDVFFVHTGQRLYKIDPQGKLTNIDKDSGWTPRVRKLDQDGKLTTLFAVAPEAGQSPDQPDSFIGSKAGDQRQVFGVKLCWCPPGKFTMGSPRSEPERRRGIQAKH